MAGSWSADNLTDGFIPAAILPRWGRPRDAKRLVEVGLWHDAEQDGEKGWRFHEWAERQPTRAQKMEERAVRAVAGRKGGKASGASRREAKQQANAKQSASPVLEPPSRPDPSPTSGGDGEPSAQPLIGEWIEHCTERPPGRVVGQVSKEVKAMLSEGIPAERVRVGLAEWQRKGLHASTLPSVVHEVASRAQPAARERPHVSEIEQPPDGLTDEEYRDWWQKRRRA